MGKFSDIMFTTYLQLFFKGIYFEHYILDNRGSFAIFYDKTSLQGLQPGKQQERITFKNYYYHIVQPTELGFMTSKHCLKPPNELLSDQCIPLNTTTCQ